MFSSLLSLFHLRFLNQNRSTNGAPLSRGICIAAARHGQARRPLLLSCVQEPLHFGDALLRERWQGLLRKGLQRGVHAQMRQVWQGHRRWHLRLCSGEEVASRALHLHHLQRAYMHIHHPPPHIRFLLLDSTDDCFYFLF